MIDHLEKHGEIANREYQDMTGASARTASRDLAGHVERGLLVRVGERGRYSRYRLAKNN